MKGLLFICIGTLFVSFALSQTSPVCGPEDDFLPHPTDCSLYYACSGGEAVLNNCPEGLWWNTLTNGCDWPFNVNCAAETTTDATPTGTTDSSTGTTGTDTTGTGTTDTSTSTNSTLTTSSVTPTGTIDTSTSTNSTLTTSSGTSTGTTGTGTLPTETTSDGTSTGTTGTGTVPTEPTDSSTTSTTPSTTTSDISTEPPGGLPQSCPAVDDPNNIIRLPHESICEYYYLCSGGVPTTYSCSGGQQFSPTTRKCRDPEAAACDRCPTVLDTPNQVSRLPHETDCHLYYLCSADASSLLFQCSSDWQFSRNVRECLSQEDAKCTL